MYQNPFAIKPGEVLTHQQLFDRFLDWVIFNQPFTSNPTPACDKELKDHQLCCHDHFQYQAESSTFYRYFDYLEMLKFGKLPSIALRTQNTPISEWNLGPFSVVTMGFVIRELNLKVDAEKYKKAWGSQGERAFHWL